MVHKAVHHKPEARDLNKHATTSHLSPASLTPALPLELPLGEARRSQHTETCPEDGQEGRGKKVQYPATLEIFKKLMESVQQNSGWLTASEAAEYLKVQTRSLLLWVRQGKLQACALRDKP
jgi:excisionase family DNA binding protein